MENHFSCCLALAYRSAWLANEFTLKTNTTTTAFLTIYHLVFDVTSTILVHSVTILVFHFQPFWSTCVCLLSTVTQLGCTDFLHFGALFHLPLPRYLSNFAGILFHIICGGLADLYRMLAVSLSVIPVHGTCDFLALRILRTQFVVAATVALCRLSPILDWATGDFSLQFVTQLCS